MTLNEIERAIQVEVSLQSTVGRVCVCVCVCVLCVCVCVLCVCVRVCVVCVYCVCVCIVCVCILCVCVCVWSVNPTGSTVRSAVNKEIGVQWAECQ
jgi:hypothetical protein